jgi:tetratricopeptide (TPR) repeat protein
LSLSFLVGIFMFSHYMHSIQAYIIIGGIFASLLGCDAKNSQVDDVQLSGKTKSNETQMNFGRDKEEHPKDAQALYRLAKTYHEKGDLDLAIKSYLEALHVNQQIKLEATKEKDKSKSEFRDAVPLDRDIVDLYVGLGDAYRAQNQWDDAIDNYTESIQLSSLNSEAFYGRGVAFVGKRLTDPALNDFSTAINLKPHNVQYLCKRASLFNSMQYFNLSINDCLQAIAINLKCAAAVHILGLSYASQKPPQIEKAIATLEEAQRLNVSIDEQMKSMLAEMYYLHGKVLHHGEYCPEADKEFNHAIKLDSAYSDKVDKFLISVKKDNSQDRNLAQYNELLKNGSDSLDQNQFGPAVQIFTEATRVMPNRAEAFYGRGLAFLGKNDPAAAVGDFNKAILLNHEYAEAYCQRALAQERLGNVISAINDCTEAIRLKPDYTIAYYHRFYSYFKNTNYDRALADIQAVEKFEPGLAQIINRAKADIYCRRGIEYMAKKDWYKAIYDFDLAKELNTDYFKPLTIKTANIYYQIASSLYYEGEYSAAIENLDNAILLVDETNNKKKADYLCLRGMAHYLAQQKKEAIDDFTQMVLDNPMLEPKIPREISNNIISPKSRMEARLIGK